jgi:hypothetical protein
MLPVASSCQIKRGVEQRNEGKVESGKYKLYCESPKLPEYGKFKKTINEYLGEAIGSRFDFSDTLKYTIAEKVSILASFSQQGLDLDLVLFRICEMSINRNLSEKETSELISQAINSWERSLPTQEQINLLNHLKEELLTNIQTLEELRKNSINAFKIVETITGENVLRNKGVKILPILFPDENITSFRDSFSISSLVDSIDQRLYNSRLLKDSLEVYKFNQAGQSIRSTVLRTQSVLESLSDRDQTRYVIQSEIWDNNQDVLRKVNIFNTIDYQKTYRNLKLARTNYDILTNNFLKYLSQIEFFFDPKSGSLDRNKLIGFLTTERFAIELMIDFGNELTNNIEELNSLYNKLYVE